MKKALSFILSITMLLGVSSAALANNIVVCPEEAEPPREVKILRVGINAEHPPFEYYEEDKLTGFDVDLMNYIGEKIGYDIEFVNMSFDKLIPAVVNDEVDCAISGITITKERESVIDYTKPYLVAQIEIDGGFQYEQYAIVFKDGVSDAIYKSSMPTDYEKLFMLANGTIEELISDATVEKLIEKYELNKSTAETGYSYFIASEVPGDVEIGVDSETTVPAPSEWAAKDIDFAYAIGITDINKQYIYQNNITREEFCELIYNLVTLVETEITVPVTDSFTDTKNEKILMLNGLGIINGKTATEFAPQDSLTREEAATILWRLYEKGYIKAALGTTAQWIKFADEKEISDWALFNVQNIYKAGIMNGVGENRFAPKEAYTTEQAIVTIARVYKSAENDGAIDRNSSIGIIGGADGPTSIIVGDNVNVIEKEEYENFYVEVTKNTTEVDDFYIDEAIKLITESGNLAANKDFISLYTTNDDTTNKILSLSTVDFNKPTDIFYLSADREQIIANIEALAKAEGVDIEELGDAWFEHLWRRIDFSTLASMINSSYGSENLAAITILTNNRGYIMPEDFQNNFALFVQYEGEYSAIVSFSKFGDGVISANMTFVKNGDKDNVFRRIYEITQGLGEDSIEVAIVK